MRGGNVVAAAAFAALLLLLAARCCALPRLVDVSSTAVSPALPGLEKATYAWTDYDADGGADFACIGQGLLLIKYFFLYRQTSSGAFQDVTGPAFPLSTPPGSLSGSVVWGDLDGNGWLDVAYSGSQFSFFKQFPNHTFQNALSIFVDPPDKGDALTFADYNADGKTDLLTIGNRNFGRIFVRHSNTSIVDVAFDVYLSFPPTLAAAGLAASDFNGDGRMDLAMSGSYYNLIDTIRVYELLPEGYLSDITTLRFGRSVVAAENAEVIWIDYNRDGFLDLSISGDAFLGVIPVVALYRNNGSFFQLQPLVGNISGMLILNHVSHSWADVDNNGYVDVVYSATGIFYLALQTSPDVFVEGSSLVLGYPPSETYASVAFHSDSNFLFMIISGTLPLQTKLFRTCRFGLSYNQTSGACGLCSSAESCCPFGLRSSANLTACEACPSGAVVSASQKSCTPCAAGTEPEAASQTCAPCAAGSSSLAGSTCVLCPPGSYAATPGSSECSPCGPGTVSAAAGSSSCVSCQPGTGPSSNRTSCGACPLGEFSAQGVCSPCPSASVPSGDFLSCVPCGDGEEAAGGRCVSSGSSANIGAAVGGALGGGAAIALLAACCVGFLLILLCCVLLCALIVLFAVLLVAVAAVAGAGTVVSGAGVFLFTRRRYRDAPKLVEEIEDAELRLQRAMAVDEVREIPWSEIELISKIGSGAFGVVHLAEWRGVSVAVKLLRELSDAALEDFQQEALMMSRISFHPHVVGFIGVSRSNDSLAMVLHYCPGGNLLSALVARRLSVAQKSIILWQIASALAFLHSLRIVHRDVAARNVLLESDDKAKLSDLGLSRLLDSADQEKGTQCFVGPVRWMAPESITSATYSAATDAYSFGVLMWEIWSDGAIPYSEAKDLMAVALEVGRSGRRLVPPSAAPPDHAALMLRLFATDPRSRPSLDEVEALLHDRSATRRGTMSDSSVFSGNYLDVADNSSNDGDLYVAAAAVAK